MSLPSESFVTCRTQIANQQKEAEGAEEKGQQVREGGELSVGKASREGDISET